jgi:hypothetical protein
MMYGIALPGPAGEGGLDCTRPLTRANAVSALLDCAQACTTFADARLHEDDIADLLGAVRTVLDCADTCADTVRALTRRGGSDGGLLAALLGTCAAACRIAAVRTRADKRCAGSCRTAVRACEELLHS